MAEAGDEALDLDRPGGGERQRGEVLVGHGDHRAVGVLVRLDGLGGRYLLLVEFADLVVPDPAAVGEVDLPEGDRVVLGGVHQLDRNADQAERDGAVPDGPHGSPLTPEMTAYMRFHVILIV